VNTTTTITTTVLQPFDQDYPGEPVQEETFTYSHLFWSSIILICFIHLLWSMLSSLFNLQAWQSLHNLSPSFLWSTSWSGTLPFILHTFSY